ncbi:DoxX family protein [Streptomyces sp. NPDC093111]|uniref:DoxX family protein n=1 Tax=Streptomyces sp. NPDC093111 TaxID=3154978 RepID=UPI00343186DE
MRFVVGALEGAAAVLLVIPDRRARFLAATTLMFVLTGAATTHIVKHDPAVESWAAPTHLVIMGILALANWPVDWRDLLRAPKAPAAGGVAAEGAAAKAARRRGAARVS